MFKKRLILSFGAMVLGFTGLAQDAADEYKLLFIGIDGVRSDALQQQMNNGVAPNLKEMFDEGLYTFDSWHLGVTSSGPSWSDMLTGVWENKHGVTSNNYTGSDYNAYPYFTTRIKECRPDAKAVQVTSWQPMSSNVYNDGWDSKIVPPTDDACTQVAINQLQDVELDILFVHIDDVDGAGHGNGFNPAVPAYMNAIAYADQQVGQIIAAVESRPNYANEKWVILATTDHGGTGTGHGGNSDDERHIWWVATGHNVPQTEITGVDPGSYQFGTPPTDAAVAQVPVLTDIAVTAIDHCLPDTICFQNNQAAWDLDGKSWLEEEQSVYVEAYTLQKEFGVYPNPNNGVFDIVVDIETDERFDVVITDISGQVVYQSTLENHGAYSKKKMDISGYASGAYMLTLTGEHSAVTKKIVKN